MTEKRLILARHAHRDTSDREADNGLSSKGWEQARSLTRRVLLALNSQPARILSSPKTRCRETLELLAQARGADVGTEPLLDEQHPDESFADFHKRIEKFQQNWLSSSESIWVVCTHGDWIPAALSQWIGEEIDLKKGAFAEISAEKGSKQIIQLVQDPSSDSL